ncbi:MAG: ArnT family glycosyltransferase [Thermoanaerobaculia bacterium]
MIGDRSTPEPLQRRQQLAVWVATLVTGATRVWGLASSPWDWDEILFSLALRHYDVALHHPHPPGFPLFIAAARLFRLTGLSDFRSLQAVNLVAGVLLVPAMFFFCRELRLKFSTSLIASLFLAFFPNVWFFGETAFSDVPSIVLVVFACGLLLRGCRSDRAYFGGAIVLAIAGAFRPQNLVIGFAPFIIATWLRRRVWLTVAAIISAALILAASYGAAAAATGGWERYRQAALLHQQYITATDSFRSPTRPPLHHLLDDFFVRPYRAPLINVFVTGFALISVGVSLLRRRVPVLIAIASFSPFCLAAWLLLDHFSASRFSIGFAPMIAILSADGVALLSLRRESIEWAIGLALTALMFVWTVPAIDLPRRGHSPPVQATEWLRSHASMASSQIYVHEGIGPYAEYFLDRYRVEWTLDGPPIARLGFTPAWYMKEGTSALPGAINFSWPQGRASQVTRRRYFDVSVIPLHGAARFGDGWYDEEAAGKSVWRWMGARGTVELPPIAGKARLRLRLFVPLHVMPLPPSITVRLNGAVIESLRPRTPFIDIVHDGDGSAYALTIETDRVVNPQREKLGGDPRDLGLRLDRLEWIAVER